MVVHEGRPPILVVYAGWREWRVLQSDPLPAPPLAPASGCFCPTCWAQGRILEEAGNGEGLIPVTCAQCDGTGWIIAA